MAQLEVSGNDGGEQSYWVVKGPAGSEVEWDAEIIEEKPGELITWRTLPGASVPNAGAVRFEKEAGWMWPGGPRESSLSSSERSAGFRRGQTLRKGGQNSSQLIFCGPNNC